MKSGLALIVFAVAPVLFLFFSLMNPAAADDTTERELEAQKLVDKVENLTPAEEKRLIEIGDEAFDSLYNLLQDLMQKCESKETASTRYSCRDKELQKYRSSIELLIKVAKKKHTKEMISLLHKTMACPTERSLITWIHENANKSEYIPVFIKLLEDKESAERRNLCSSGFLLRKIVESKDKRAVDFLMHQLKDSEANPVCRSSAFTTLAVIGGEKGLNAVLNAKDSQRKTKVIRHAGIDKLGMKVMDRPRVDYKKAYLKNYQSKLLDKRKDKNGVLWGLISSMALGSYKDLWISRHDGKQWSEPLYTGTKLDELGDKDWFKTFIGNPDITRDSDGDSLTDLAEQRLGTDPKKPDTDGDGIKDSVDKNPLAAPRKLNDYEKILAAAFEARYKFAGWRDVPILLNLPEGVEPLEFMGWDRVIIVSRHKEKHPMAKVIMEGIASAHFGLSTFLDDDPEKEGWIREGFKVYWNKDRTEARLSVDTYYGPTDATGFHIRLRKFGDIWVVVRCEMVMIS